MTKRVRILDIPLNPISFEQATKLLKNFVRSGIPHQIATINPEFIVAAQKNSEFKQTLKNSELNISDGAGIRIAAHYYDLLTPSWQPVKLIVALVQGIYVGTLQMIRSKKLANPIPETITGVHLSEEILGLANDNGWKVYLLGGNPGNAQLLAKNTLKKFPNIKFVGAEEGIKKDVDLSDTVKIKPLVDKIRRAQPDILLVAFGAPRQDLFIANFRDQLAVPVMMGVGGTFEFLTGKIRRAPAFLRMLGLEWAWRLAIQPNRWRRIVNAVIVFPWLVFIDKLNRD